MTTNRFKILTAALIFIAAFALVTHTHAQNVTPNGQTAVQVSQPQYYKSALTATASAGSPAVLTLPTPPNGLYTYVCDLAFQVSVGAGGTVTTNGTSSSTNFGGFAYKVSNPGTANTDGGVQVLLTGTPSTGCSKSVSPGTATTFTSPTTAATAFVWYSTFFQAP